MAVFVTGAGPRAAGDAGSEDGNFNTALRRDWGFCTKGPAAEPRPSA
jgi:hypothetical protein